MVSVIQLWTAKHVCIAMNASVFAHFIMQEAQSVNHGRNVAIMGGTKTRLFVLKALRVGLSRRSPN
jgi:hypothetical protein